MVKNILLTVRMITSLDLYALLYLNWVGIQNILMMVERICFLKLKMKMDFLNLMKFETKLKRH